MGFYSDPLGRLAYAAGGAGGAAGGSLLGRIGETAGSLLAPLDYPRQALWNLFRSGKDFMDGQGDTDDLLAAIPGALGVGATGALAASGVGLPLAVLLGSGLGALGQGIGKSSMAGRVDEEGRQLENPFEAAHVSDLTSELGGDPDSFLQNLLVGIPTDPLSYAGLSGAGNLARKVGEKLGLRWETAARALHPPYPGGGTAKLEKLGGVPMPRSGTGGHSMADVIATHPQREQMLAELHPEFEFAGGGAQAAAFKSPYGITKFVGENPADYGHLGPVEQLAPATPTNIPEVMAPARSMGYGRGTPWRVEHFPEAHTVDLRNPSDFDTAWSGQADLLRGLGKQGIGHADPHLNNIGFDAAGAPTFIDSGGLYEGPMSWGMRDVAAEQPWIQGAGMPKTPQMGPVEKAIFNLTNPAKRVRGELESTMSAGRGIPPIPPSTMPSGATPEELLNDYGLFKDISAKASFGSPRGHLADYRLAQVRKMLKDVMDQQPPVALSPPSVAPMLPASPPGATRPLATQMAATSPLPPQMPAPLTMRAGAVPDELGHMAQKTMLPDAGFHAPSQMDITPPIQETSRLPGPSMVGAEDVELLDRLQMNNPQTRGALTERLIEPGTVPMPFGRDFKMAQTERLTDLGTSPIPGMPAKPQMPLNDLTKNLTSFSNWEELTSAMKGGYVPTFSRSSAEASQLGAKLEAMGFRVFWIK